MSTDVTYLQFISGGNMTKRLLLGNRLRSVNVNPAGLRRVNINILDISYTSIIFCDLPRWDGPNCVQCRDY